MPLYNKNSFTNRYLESDYGPQPYVVDIHKATLQNTDFRRALWTGTHQQITLMCIPVGGEVGLESHPHLDQLLSIEDGYGYVMMGNSCNRLNYRTNIREGYAVLVPAGTWHNVVNIGRCPIKLYSIYAPPQHPHGTIHRTKTEADMDEGTH